MDKTVKFKTVFNGYSKTEVDQYLNELDTQYQNEHLAISPFNAECTKTQ